LILNFFMYFTLHISTSLSRDGTPHMLQILTHYLHFSETLMVSICCQLGL
jgi:hypothetical protein